MALEGKAEGNFLSAVSELFKFLVSCELTQFPISESQMPFGKTIRVSRCSDDAADCLVMMSSEFIEFSEHNAGRKSPKKQDSFAAGVRGLQCKLFVYAQHPKKIANSRERWQFLAINLS
jgi:hypothetical protein